MYHVQVEELEPRHLLNGSRFFPPPSDPPAAAVGAFTARDADRSPFVVGYDRPGGWDWTGGGGPQWGPTWLIILDWHGRRDPVALSSLALDAAGPGAGGLETRGLG